MGKRTPPCTPYGVSGTEGDLVGVLKQPKSTKAQSVSTTLHPFVGYAFIALPFWSVGEELDSLDSFSSAVFPFHFNEKVGRGAYHPRFQSNDLTSEMKRVDV